MKQQWSLIDDQVLVETELASSRKRHRGVDAVDAFGDFVDVRAGLRIADHGTLLRGGP
jgi:hypothetical protein